MTLDEDILQHIDEEGDYLKALYRDTHLKLLYPRMASGHLQVRMLKMFVRMIRPRQVLEIGTYSGYSALCMAEGLPDNHLEHTPLQMSRSHAGIKQLEVRIAIKSLQIVALFIDVLQDIFV